MPLMTKFHCDDCGGENLIFDASAVWDGVRFDLKHVHMNFGYCRDCKKKTAFFQSNEMVFFDDEKPPSGFDPMKQTGNL